MQKQLPLLLTQVIRILSIGPLGQHLQNGFIVFSDEKDAGLLALTPIYLLIGFSLPLWLHPAPCDITNSAGFNLLPLMSGILTIGVGDTAAATVGTLYGRHKWPGNVLIKENLFWLTFACLGTKKSFEGTIACIISQSLVVAVLLYFGKRNVPIVALNVYSSFS